MICFFTIVDLLPRQGTILSATIFIPFLKSTHSPRRSIREPWFAWENTRFRNWFVIAIQYQTENANPLACNLTPELRRCICAVTAMIDFYKLFLSLDNLLGGIFIFNHTIVSNWTIHSKQNNIRYGQAKMCLVFAKFRVSLRWIMLNFDGRFCFGCFPRSVKFYNNHNYVGLQKQKYYVLFISLWNICFSCHYMLLFETFQTKIAPHKFLEGWP